MPSCKSSTPLQTALQSINPSFELLHKTSFDLLFKVLLANPPLNQRQHRIHVLIVRHADPLAYKSPLSRTVAKNPVPTGSRFENILSYCIGLKDIKAVSSSKYRNLAHGIVSEELSGFLIQQCMKPLGFSSSIPLRFATTIIWARNG